MTIIEEVKALDEVRKNTIISEALECQNAHEIIELGKSYGKEISEDEAKDIMDVLFEKRYTSSRGPILGDYTSDDVQDGPEERC